MRFSAVSLLATGAALAGLSSAQTTGNATVVNHCSQTLYVWSVDSTMGPENIVPSGQSYTEEFHTDPKTGVAIKIVFSSDGLFNGSPQTDFAYTLDGSLVYYDLSDVFGDPFQGQDVALVPSDTSCQSIVWSNGVPPSGNPTQACESGTNLVLTLC
jgi:hypothetical protein